MQNIIHHLKQIELYSCIMHIIACKLCKVGYSQEK